MRTIDRNDALLDEDARRAERYRVRLYAGRAKLGDATANFKMIYDLSRTGFLTDAVPQRGPGDWLRVHLPTIGDVEARIVREAEGLFGCEFSQPLTQAQLLAARAGSKVIWPEFGGAQLRDGAVQQSGRAPEQAPSFDPFGADEIDEPARWPLPARTAIWVGGAAALWGLVTLAIR
jgi:hypothetical protein